MSARTWLARVFGLDVQAAGANRITTSKDLEDVLLSGWGMQTRSGITVTPEVALGVAAVSAAVGILAETLAQLPLMVYRRLDRGGKEKAPDHPLWPLLHDKPNGWQNSFEYREMQQLQLGLKGNVFAFKNMVAGRVGELLPIHPSRVTVHQDADYAVTYKVSLPSGEYLTLPKERIFHIRDRSMNGITGMSRLENAKECIGLSVKAEAYGAQFFGNAARPSGVLSTEQKVSPEQMKELRESWKAVHGGENAGGTAVVDAGWKWSAMTMNNDDAQFLETRKFQIGEVARIWRVPPHMLGDLERATFSNIEQQSLEFVKYSMMPWLRRWESAINDQLVPENEKGKVFAEFNVDGLLRGDFLTRVQGYSTGLKDGWLNRNEVRDKENMSPIEGGDEYHRAESIHGGTNEPAQTAQP